MKKFANRVANQIKKKAQENSPFVTGELKRSWKIQRIKSGTEVKIAIRNMAFYAHLVEDGHIKKDKNKKVIGFKPGQHMLKNAINEVERNLEEYFKKEFFR